MIDPEVERLRQLRDCALRVRAVARTAGRSEWTPGDALLENGGRAAWRIARVVAGRLRAHPHQRFQKGAGVGVLLMNSIVAHVAVAANRTPQGMLRKFSHELNTLIRQLDDARALTWIADLSDAFGRSQRELRALAAALEVATATFPVASISCEVSPLAHRLRDPNPSITAGGRAMGGMATGSTETVGLAAGDETAAGGLAPGRTARGCFAADGVAAGGMTAGRAARGHLVADGVVAGSLLGRPIARGRSALDGVGARGRAAGGLIAGSIARGRFAADGVAPGGLSAGSMARGRAAAGRLEPVGAEGRPVAAAPGDWPYLAF